MGRGSGAGGGGGGGRGRAPLEAIPTRTGTYRLALSALDDATGPRFGPNGVGFDQGRLDRVKAEHVSGKQMVPIRVVVQPSGRVLVADGQHRLQAARARGDKWIDARVEIVRGRG